MILNMIGGSNPLNFKVVGGTSSPASPKENTIWVNTDVPVAGWVFSATEPEAPTEGLVWISTGTSSATEFNALKKHGIQVYPIAAKQYVSGAWVDKEAKIYQGGAWVDWWNGELFQNGNQYTAITGGWSESGYSYYSSYHTVAPQIGNTIKITANNYAECCAAGTQKAVDLTDAKTLYLDVLSTSGYCCVCVVDERKSVYQTDWIAGMSLSVGTIALDVIAVTGAVYVVVFAAQGDYDVNTAEVNNIRWE